LKTEHLGHERYVRDEECREALQEKILEILEQDKEIEQLRKALIIHGRHADSCKKRSGKKCNCGFERVLKRE